MNIFFYDVETTGFHHEKNGLHEIAYLIDSKKQVINKKSFNVKPFEGCAIKEEALLVGGVTLEQVQSYPEEDVVFKLVEKDLSNAVYGGKQNEKLFLAGYNIDAFDNRFFMKFFERNTGQILEDFFESETFDVLKMAKDYFKKRGLKLINYKMETVAQYFNIEYNPADLHKGFGDVLIVREIYYKLTA